MMGSPLAWEIPFLRLQTTQDATDSIHRIGHGMQDRNFLGWRRVRRMRMMAMTILLARMGGRAFR